MRRVMAHAAAVLAMSDGITGGDVVAGILAALFCIWLVSLINKSDD